MGAAAKHPAHGDLIVLNLIRSSGRERRFEALQGAQIPTFRQLLPALEAEIERTRRYQRPLSMLAIGPGEILARKGTHALPDIIAAPFDANFVAFLVLGSLLTEATRDVDVVTQLPEAGVYGVLLPETSASDAWRLAGRLARTLAARAPIGLLAGIAEFPRHALRVDDLLAFARGALQMVPIEQEREVATQIGSGG